MTPRLLLLIPTTTWRASAFVEAAKRIPVELSIVSEKPSTLTQLHPVSLPALDFGSASEVTRFARTFADASSVRAVVGVDDQAAVAAASIAATLGVRHNSPAAVYDTTNKFRTRERLRAAGLPCPWYRLLSNDDDLLQLAPTLGYPAVVKPLMMAASRGVLRADDASSFIAACERTRAVVAAHDAPGDPISRAHLLVEAYVPGWEVAVEGIVTDGKLHVIAIFDKPDPLEGPTFPETLYVTPSRLGEGDIAAVVDASARAVDALDIAHGAVHIELRGNANGVFVIEMAARSIGGLCSRVLRFQEGLTLEDVILRHALGILPEIPALSDRAAGVNMMQSTRRGLFRGITGIDAARAVPGVRDIIVGVHPGRRIDPLPEGFLYLAFVFATGDTPATVETSLRRADACMTIEMEEEYG